MSALSNIVVNDGKATPVAHTFTPLTLDNSSEGSIAVYVESGSASSEIGWNEAGLSFRVPKGSRSAGQVSGPERVYKVSLWLNMPTLESTSAATGSGIAPAPTVAYVHRVRCDFFLPARGVYANRLDLRTMLKNALDNGQVVSAIDTLQGTF